MILDKKSSSTPGIMLQKYLAQSGKYSRRQAEELIRAGKVSVNKTQAKPGDRVFKGDKVMLGKVIIGAKDREAYLIMNKPKGYVCTNRKFKGEMNIFELIGDGIVDSSSLKVAGRLDKESRGLLLLTTDGDLIQKLTHPRYGHEKEYITQINTNLGQIDAENICRALIKGVDIGEGDGVVRAKEAQYPGGGKFRIVLTEGKKRQIRRMFASLGFEVEDLVRIRIGKLKLGSLKEGKFRNISLKDIGVF